MKNHMKQPAEFLMLSGLVGVIASVVFAVQCVFAAGGSLTVSVREEADDLPVITRAVIQRAEVPNRRVVVRTQRPPTDSMLAKQS